MIALFISILISLTTVNSDGATSSKKDGAGNTTTTASMTTMGGTSTWENGTK